MPSWHERRNALAIAGVLLVAVALDLCLLRPLLIGSSLASSETRRAYYEPDRNGIAVMLDRQHAGYITDLEVDGADLTIPGSTTSSIPRPSASR